jgi:hypothetical protein
MLTCSSLDDADPNGLPHALETNRFGFLVNSPSTKKSENCDFIKFPGAWKDEFGREFQSRLMYRATKSMTATFSKRGYLSLFLSRSLARTHHIQLTLMFESTHREIHILTHTVTHAVTI